MPHGTPDWGLVGPKATVFGLDDLGEHAVRLGSPHLWDRRGDLLFATDFRDGVGALTLNLSGGLAAIDLMTGHSRQGAYALRLTTGNTANFEAFLMLDIPQPVSSGIGLEFSFSGVLAACNWHARIDWADAVRAYRSEVQWNVVGVPPYYLQYWDDTGAFQDHGDPTRVWVTNRPVYVLKMVIDMARHEYVRAIFNNVQHDLRGLGVEDTGGSVVSMMQLSVRFEGTLGFNKIGYVDNVIVTQNEP